MRSILLLLVILLLSHGTTAPGAAQVIDNFADGDFTTDPPWQGEAASWTVVPFGDDFALRTDGPASADTLHLATASAVSYGTWSLTFRYEGGRLTNFNKVRVYLLADQANLEGAVHGYHLELGTQNRDVVLYRSDPTRSGGRVALAASAAQVLPEEEHTLALLVTRTTEHMWTVRLDGNDLFTFAETEAVIPSNVFFGFWVKHSASRRQSFFFDDVHIEGATGPDDTIPPRITTQSYSAAYPGFAVAFSETVDFTTVQRSDFTISAGIGSPEAVFPRSGTSTTQVVDLQVSAPLAAGSYSIDVRAIADLAGNVLRDTSVTIEVEGDDEPPSLAEVQAVAADQVVVTFSEPVVNACEPARYELSDGIGAPADVDCAVPTGGGAPRTVTLILAHELAPGRYTLTVRDLQDEAGNARAVAQHSFVYSDGGDVPAARDVVINEINYAAFGQDLEYIEVYNRSAKTFDLRRFLFADANRQPQPITDEPTPLAPDAYAVLVRDSAAFQTLFPGVPVLAPHSWPALNNSGDTVFLFFEDTTTVDAVAFDPSWGGGTTSLERIDPSGPSNAAANFDSSVAPAGGTPGTQNSLYAVDTEPPALTTATPADAGDSLYLAFSEPLDPATVTPAAFTIEQDAAPHVAGATVEEERVALALEAALQPGTYTLVVRGVADYSGNELDEGRLDFTYFAGATPSTQEVVINEIMYDPPETTLEYVELYNRSEETFDLRDLRLADSRLAPVPITDASRPFTPDQYIVLVRNATAFGQIFPDIDAVEVANWPELNNSGDTPTVLFDGTVIDAVPYRPGWGGTNVALERRDPRGLSDSPTNFASSTAPRGGTPGSQNSVFAPDVEAPQLIFAEQTAPDELHAYFNEPVAPATLTADHFSAGGVHPTTATPGTSRTEVRLAFTAPVEASALAATDLADAAGNVQPHTEIPIARRPAPGDLVINEIMYAPRADPDDNRPDQPEYVELYNRTGHLLSLRNLVAVDAPNEQGEADTLGLTTEPVGIAPEGYAVLFAQPQPTDAPATASMLARAFSEIDFTAADVTLLPLTRSTLGLRNSEERVQLVRSDGTVVDAAHYHDAWASPNVERPGTALERISPEAPSNRALTWASSTAAAGGTPGLPNSVASDPAARQPQSGDLVINEIMYAPRADPDDNRPDQPEYVELYNASRDPLALNGLFLTDAPDEHGMADTLRLAYSPATLPPGGYAVAYGTPSTVPPSDVARVLTDAFPEADPDAPDAVLLPLRGTSLSLRNDGRLLRLHGPDGTELDAVTYDPNWHSPDLRDATGVALERMTPSGSSNEAANWSSSVAPAGGTPARANSIFVDAGVPPSQPGLRVVPSPFSPDGDGFDDVASIQYTLAQDIATVRVRIFDQGGRLVRTLSAADLSARSGQLTWDGRDDEDRRLRIGIYVVVLDAVNAAGGAIEAFKAPVVLARPLD